MHKSSWTLEGLFDCGPKDIGFASGDRGDYGAATVECFCGGRAL
jgi:hypothetical protein